MTLLNSIPPHYVGDAAMSAGISVIAREIADSMIDSARTSGDDPIAWVTGNSYMPPLRAFSGAEQVWQMPLTDAASAAWEWLFEEVERLVEAANVYLTSPDYDNSLYVCDLNRFEAVPEDEVTGDNLSDEWRPIVR